MDIESACIPEKILSYMGTQFVSECMSEVSRLLIKHQETDNNSLPSSLQRSFGKIHRDAKVHAKTAAAELGTATSVEPMCQCQCLTVRL